MNTIAKIRELGIPTGSYCAAIRYLNDRPELKKDEYENLIKQLTGTSFKGVDHRESRYVFLYLIQETIRQFENTDIFDMYERLEYAVKCANKLFTEQAYHWAEPDEEVKVDSAGKPKRKKGAKQVEALRIYNENIDEGKAKIIELFMSELDMSKAGATTYFYNMKKKAEND